MATELPPGVIKAGLALFAWLVMAPGGMTAQAGDSAELSVEVRDADGQPVAEAAVLVRALDQDEDLPSGREEVVDQVDREFVPPAIVVPVNTRILFPNNDDIRHHVYSFSEAKQFELPLYTGTPSRPIEFPNPGIVTIACNIHDWMTAHIYVVDARWHGLTDDDGIWRASGLPAGRYEVEVWHHGLVAEQQTVGEIELAAEASAEMEAMVEIATGPAPRRAPRPGRRGYR